MDLEMIINCRVTCMWMRMRDGLLLLFSGLLWATLLVVLFRIEVQEFLGFISSFYLAMVFLVTGLLLSWSQYRKSISRLVSKKTNRRTRYTAVAPRATAKYFLMEEKQVRALQREKSTVVQHGQDGHPSFLLFHTHSLMHSVPFKKKIAQYHAAA